MRSLPTAILVALACTLPTTVHPRAQSATFEINGEVTNPGTYSYLDGMTVINAIALAGGFSSKAAFDDIVIIRDGTRLDASDLTVAIMPGDTISIQPTSIIKRPAGR